MKGKTWNLAYEDAPWFDQPDALDRVAKGRGDGLYDADQAALLTKWIEDGWLVVERAIAPKRIDRVLDDLDALWTSDTPVPGLKIDEPRLRPSDPPGLPHEQIGRLPAAERARLKTAMRWRIHGFQRFSAGALDLFEDRRLHALATMLFGRPCEPENSILFMYGTEQDLHQDMGVFAIAPLNHLVGAWIALEDIGPESGPLVFYPGSHRERMWAGFENYPQTHVKTSTPEMLAGYEAYVKDVASRHPRRTFLAKKGDVLFWHGMMLHGGDAIADSGRTRRSFVLHYVPPGMSVEDQIEGPFLW